MSGGLQSSGVNQATQSNQDSVAEMQKMANENNAMTMASMQINMQQQMTSAIASVGNNGAKNVADAAKGQ
ncbi:hypothetical protein BWP39_22945 [Paraburkholderia acidicola]|uniref:Uncharacterized protein n=1 Tax=Paraburkholderia acidicola TaxID=1912599 RepID=A0A2A4ER09_9BURK|nr:hypothetical protein [Paraburkholderia acidicola]PCE22539.1 hypothetical protein BWP39_22945 [Paraburkholderia acidicola]